MSDEADRLAAALSGSKLQFRPVNTSEETVQFLYDLLMDRKGAARISAIDLPSFQGHRNFVGEHPYRAWFTVHRADRAIGALYLGKDNSVGIHVLASDQSEIRVILRAVMECVSPLPAVASVRSAHFIVNVGAFDLEYESLLVDEGATLIQKTFTLPAP